MITDYISLVATVLEIIGVFLMANTYMRIGDTGLKKYVELAKGLMSALYKGKHSKSVDYASGWAQENTLSALQGVAFIAIGFIIQAGNIVYQIATA